uniref:J domain-containing protein n=1 Tax=Ditylenchus dipsaci TaxID=166011 RepID=A0A915E4R9_9BILA
MATRELNFSPFELRKMMFELEVNETVDIGSLKASFIEKIRSHHTDKGGNAEKAKELTRAYRILKNYLEAKIRLPVRGDFPNQYSHPSDNYRNGFDDFGDFQQPNRRRRKGGGGFPQRDHQSGRGPQFEQDGPGEDNEEEFPSADARPVFINGYTYDTEDYSSFDDPMEKASSSSTERMRKVRGGLILQMDFLRNAILEEEYEEIGKLGDENAMYMNPLFTPLLEKLKCLEEDVYSFTEKMKVFVNLDWACSEEIQSKAIVKKVKLLPVENDDTGSLFTITIPLNQFEAETFSPGLHVDVRSSNETRLFASALVDDVDEKERKVVLFFLDPMRMHTLLAVSRYVDISINASAFVFRSLIRSIDHVQTRQMTIWCFPL